MLFRLNWYRDSQVLLFDEITNSVGEDVEEKLICNLKMEYPNKTMIFITHNSGIFTHMDRIIRIHENGSVSEEKVVKNVAL